jgi:hypothetical protein
MHLRCFDPPLLAVPEQQWLCEQCRADRECFLCAMPVIQSSDSSSEQSARESCSDGENDQVNGNTENQAPVQNAVRAR